MTEKVWCKREHQLKKLFEKIVIVIIGLLFVAGFVPPVLNLLGMYPRFIPSEGIEGLAWVWSATMFIFLPMMVVFCNETDFKLLTSAVVLHALILASLYSQSHLIVAVCAIITAIVDACLFVHIMCEREKKLPT